MIDIEALKEALEPGLVPEPGADGKDPDYTAGLAKFLTGLPDFLGAFQAKLDELAEWLPDSWMKAYQHGVVITDIGGHVGAAQVTAETQILHELADWLYC